MKAAPKALLKDLRRGFEEENVAVSIATPP
jgi:hypothetical protein